MGRVVVKRRILFIPAVVLIQTAAILGAAKMVLDPPLSSPETAEPFNYASSRVFSEPAVAGMVRFGNSCAECHGAKAEGTDRGPGLLDRSYTATFRESEAFHGAVGREIAAHRELLAMPGADPATHFNSLEMMGKFLREARKHHEAE